MSDRSLKAEMLAEFLGTFILLSFGIGSVAASVLLNAVSGSFEIAICWGLGVSFAIYAVGGVSGAHINPAVTLAFAVHRKFPWGKVLPYCMAQVAGAFTGAAAIYLLYRSAFQVYESAQGIVRGAANSQVTASIFSTYPLEFLSTPEAFYSEALLTAFLIIIVFSVADERNLAPKGNLGPLMVGLGVAAIGMCFGAQTGFAINPARDFGPKLFALISGWKSIALPAPGYYFWVPIVAPLVGGMLGGWLYDRFVGFGLQKKEA
jgi:glycerol uptake facilitator protein